MAIQHLKSDKHRITHQREVILEELQAVKTHPTADELYDMVRRWLPRISLATVYRNLEWLADNEMVQKIETGSRQRRFDGNPEMHYHIRCIACDRLDDVELRFVENLEDYLGEANGYKVLGHRTEFLGLCPECKMNETKKTTS